MVQTKRWELRQKIIHLGWRKLGEILQEVAFSWVFPTGEGDEGKGLERWWGDGMRAKTRHGFTKSDQCV